MTMSYLIKLAGMFLIPLLSVFVPILIGQRYGRYLIKKSPEVPHAPVGSVVGVAFGLLAFMLAFTFQIASERFNMRKELLLHEVTCIRTAYLRAGLIPEPFRSDTRKLLVEYIDIRVEANKNLSKVDYAVARSQQILDSFWLYTETLAKQDRSSEMYSLFTTSINDLVDDYHLRITRTLDYRIPNMIFWTLFTIVFFSMLVLGFQFGISNRKSLLLNLILSIIFAVVMFLILMLDRPEMRLATLNHKPAIKLQQELREKLSHER
jgi:ABC-type multidrug transport system fused ATPase/permease subunit